MPPAPVEEKRKWYGLALRHLRMASRLMHAGFADGAVFHLYHAYECAVSALIAARGYPVPPSGWTTLTLPTGKIIPYYPSPRGRIQEGSPHKARLVLFSHLARSTESYFALYTTLRRFMTPQFRNDALYYDAATDRLPQDVYDETFASGLYPSVRRFAHEVWVEIQ